MTYHRLKTALEAISAGNADPVTIATEALRSRKVVAKPKPVRRKAEDIREASTQKALTLYRDWLAAGKPPKAKFAIKLGMHPSTGTRWIKHGQSIAYHRMMRARMKAKYPHLYD